MKSTTKSSPEVSPSIGDRLAHARSGATAGPSIDCVVGLGSNLGDRRRILQCAVRSVAARARITGVSALYSSRAVGPPQPDYLNAAVRLRAEKSPLALLNQLLAIERVFGRERRERWGPRTLDLDILWIAGKIVSTAELTVPHPHLTERPFALVPLADVVPSACDPETGRPYADLVVCGGESLARVAGPEWCATACHWTGTLVLDARLARW